MQQNNKWKNIFKTDGQGNFYAEIQAEKAVFYAEILKSVNVISLCSLSWQQKHFL